MLSNFTTHSKACLASSAIRCRDVETGPNLGVLAVFPSNGATCRCLRHSLLIRQPICVRAATRTMTARLG